MKSYADVSTCSPTAHPLCSVAAFLPARSHVNRITSFHLRVDCVVLISLQKKKKKDKKLFKKNVPLLCVPACEWMCHFITKQYTVQRSIFFSVHEIRQSNSNRAVCHHVEHPPIHFCFFHGQVQTGWVIFGCNNDCTTSNSLATRGMKMKVLTVS